MDTSQPSEVGAHGGARGENGAPLSSPSLMALGWRGHHVGTDLEGGLETRLELWLWSQRQMRRKPQRPTQGHMDAGLTKAKATTTHPGKPPNFRQEYSHLSHLPRDTPTSAQYPMPDPPTWYSSRSSQCIWYLKHCPMPTSPSLCWQ